MQGSDELTAIFRAEVGEDIDKLVGALSQAAGAWTVADMLQLTHKIRGAARAVEETAIHGAATALEGILSEVRAGHPLDEECASLAREGGVLLEACFAALAGGPAPDVASYRAKAIALRSHADTGPASAPPSIEQPAMEIEAPPLEGAATVRVSIERMDRATSVAAELAVHLRTHSEYLRQAHELLFGFVDRTDAETDVRLGALHERARALLEHLTLHRWQTRRLGSEFEHEMQRLRMVPLANVRALLSKVCRDACRVTGKRAVLDMSGARSSVDRQLLEKLRDVLIQLVRNAVAHGIESQEERQRADKPPVGRITITTATRSQWLELRVEDDGRGIDLERVGRRAIEMGVVTRAELERMSAEEKLQFIYSPGLSTAPQTELAGRGVGLDVVQAETARAGGRVSVVSTIGSGTAFRIRLPLVRMTIPCIRAQVGQSIVVVPTSQVSRAMLVDPEKLEEIEGARVIRSQGRIIPVYELADLLSLEPAQSGLRPALLIDRESLESAFLVDAILGQSEVTVQPLPWNLRGLRGVTGCCNLGVHGVALVVDGPDLPRLARTISTRPLRTAARPSAPRLLVVDDSITSRTLLTAILRKNGFEVEAVEEGEKALRTLENRAFDLVVSDVEMPVLDGLTLTRRIRSDAKLRNLPVILVTSRGTAEERRSGVQAGADAYIVKSEFDQDRLLSTIGRLLESR